MLFAMLSLGSALACGDDSELAPTLSADSGAVMAADSGSSTTPLLAVSADMLNKTLSIVDVKRLVEGGTRADALVGSVDLAAYTPGPMSLAITPDGKTALVSISAGFLPLIGTSVTAGDDKLLFVDLQTRTVSGELEIGNGPMGIAITPDGKHAFVGLFGENYFAYVDIAARTYQPIDTGAPYNEEFAIDDSGEVGVISYGPAGNVRTFAIANPTQLGQTTALSGDAAGVAFFPGTKIAYLMQVPTPLNDNVGGHDLLDVTDPLRPVASDGVRIQSYPTTYPLVAVHARGSVAFPAISDGMLTVVEMKLEKGAAREVQKIPIGAAGQLAYGIGATHDSRVLVAAPETHTVSVVDLAAGNGFSIPWEGTQYGPTEIKLVP